VRRIFPCNQKNGSRLDISYREDIPVHLKQRHDLEERAATAAPTLDKIYVLTPNQSLRIVYANSWTGNVCMEYLVDGAREQSFIRYAVFEKNSKFVNYDLDQEDIEERCNMARD
jgi:hypothetical protein